ncbi:MAG: plasmid stabilization protein [Chloroflexi bacterium]|nr:plasmid stabilization protein [Chloroflexota bacterium]MCY3638729.1 plasmid stabilization protein [Chloroflexota bacterium]
MASITVRNLDEGLKRRLQIRAAENGKSMEQEVRDILRAALDEESQSGKDFVYGIRARFAELGGVELELPPRELAREPPNFDWGCEQ